jgi:hypothetical protein
MAQEEQNKLAEWLHLLRSQMPTLRRQAVEWADEVRAEPRLLWETPAVRYATYVTVGLLLLLVVSGIPSMFGPPLPPSAKAVANTADYHVLCTNADCGHHFVINRKFGFDRFPVRCPKCQQETGRQAIHCTCGRWVVPVMRDGASYCPQCGTRLP